MKTLTRSVMHNCLQVDLQQGDYCITRILEVERGISRLNKGAQTGDYQITEVVNLESGWCIRKPHT